MGFETVIAFPVGALAGFVGTLLGIGGGSIMTPAMIVCGVDPHVAVPASLFAILGTSAGGLLRLYRHGYVDVKTAVMLETASIIGAIIGALTSIRLPKYVVELVISGVLALSAALFITLKTVEKERPPILGSRASSFALAWLLSLVAGVISAVAGVGGGILKVPTMVFVLGMPVKRAVATSKLMVGITAATGVVVYAVHGYLSLALAVLLLMGTYLGATISSKILIRLPPRVVRLLAASLYVVFSVTIALKALGVIKYY